jgi:hypothetical protein
VGAGNFLVEFLGKDVDTQGEVLGTLPEGHLSEDLVGEGAGHDERRVTGGTSEVDETALGQQDDVITILHGVAINLGLDVNGLDSVLLEPSNIDFNIKVTNAGMLIRIRDGQ